MKKQINVSFILPAYNEEHIIESTINNLLYMLKRSDWTYELVVVNDGSQDNTGKIIKEISLKEKYVNIISNPINRGKGYSLLRGYYYASGVSVVFLDSDSDIVLNQINDYLLALSHGDLIIASKRHQESRVVTPFIRRFLSYSFHLLIQLFTGLRLTDCQTGLKAVNRIAVAPVMRVLTVRRFAFDVELLCVADLFGLTIIELPISLTISNSLFKISNIINMFVDLLGISYRLRVSQWYQKMLSNPEG